MDRVHRVVHGPGPQGWSMDRGSMFCIRPLESRTNEMWCFSQTCFETLGKTSMSCKQITPNKQQTPCHLTLPLKAKNYNQYEILGLYQVSNNRALADLLSLKIYANLRWKFGGVVYIWCCPFRFFMNVLEILKTMVVICKKCPCHKL